MANEQDIIVRIKAEGTDAFIKNLKAAGISVEKVGDEVEETEKKVEKSTDKMSSSFKKVGGVIAAAFATAQIGAFIKESVKLADIQLKAEAQLLKGLKGRADIQKRLIAQAKQLQKETTFGDEAIIAQQAYLANLEFTEKQIKDIIKASVDLSAGANIPLESSVRNLAKSYSGLSGELGELIPQLRDLTQDQLKNGEGVKVITELYEGQAKVLRNTGLGAVESLQNAVGDLQEELGKAVFNGLIPLADTLQGIAENENVLAFFRNIGVVLADALQAAGFALEVVARLGGDLADLLDLGDGTTPTSLEELNEQLAEEQRLLNSAKAAKEQFLKVRGDEKDAIDKLVASGKVLNADQVDRLRSINAEGKAIEDAISLRQSQVNSLNSIVVARKRDAEALKNLITPLSDFGDKTEEVIKSQFEFLNVLGKVRSEFQSYGEDAQIGLGLANLLDELSAKAALVGLSLATGLSKAQPEIVSATETTAQQIDKTDEERKAKAIESFNEISKLQSGAFNIFAARQQAELQLLDDRFQNGLISEKEYEKERRNIQRKQAKADKAQAIFQATINTAAAITSALIKGPAFIAIAAALGAAQIAAIAKTPIPKFAKGTRLVGDGYELGEDRTLAWLNKGERVITAQDNKKKFALYNAIEENDTNRIMLELAKQGIAVQFNGGLMMDDLNKPLKSLADIKGNAKKNGIDLNPLLTASDRQRVTLARKLDLLNNNVSRLGNSLGRVMTKA